MYKKSPQKSLFKRIFDTIRLKESNKENDDFYDDEEVFEEIEDYDEDLDTVPEDTEHELAIDMYQGHNSIIIQAVTAGVKLSDIDIDLTREAVAIRGARTQTHRATKEDFFTKEIYWGAFSRHIILPFEIDIDQAEAIEDHGLLTITLPKLNKDRRASLKVKTL